MQSLKSREKSFETFKQLINIKDEEVRFIERNELKQTLDNWYSNWQKQKKAFAIIGEEGDGKTWGVARWLSQQIQQLDTCPTVIFLSSNQFLTNKIIPLLEEHIPVKSNDLTVEEYMKKVDRWITESDDNTPPFLLVVDGINERNDFQWWGELLDTLKSSPWRNKVATIVTCRQEYWRRNSRYLGFSKTDTYHLPPYSEKELKKALEYAHLSRSDLSDDLLPLITKPRYFDLVVKYRKQILESGDITIPRLIFEDWKDRLERKRGIKLEDEDFQSIIISLAKDTVKKQHKKFDRQEIESKLSFVSNESDIFEELRTGGILQGKRGSYKVNSKFLSYGLGLLLLDEISEIEKDMNRLEEEIASWLEPHAEIDIKGEICHFASLIALEDSELHLNVKAALLLSWVNSLNPRKDIKSDFAKYLPVDPPAYIDLAEVVWSDPRDNSWAQELLMQTFLNGLDNQRVLDKLIPALDTWLSLVQLNGSCNQRQARSDEEIRQEINDRVGQELKHNEKFSFCGYDLIPLVNDFSMRLGRVALCIISHLPEKQFVSAIARGCLAEAIIDYPFKYDLLKLVFRYASESLWNEVYLEAQKLIKTENKVAYQAAYRLLSLEGSQRAYKLRETLPDNLFELRESLKRHQEDPCVSFFLWTKEECQLCLQKTDLEPHLIAEKLQSYCIDPDLEVPENLGNRLTPLIQKINVNSLWSSFHKDRDDHFYEHYEPALCAYAPEAIADLVKSIVRSIADRSEIGIRQLSFHIWENYLILGDTEKNAIRQAWQKFEIESNLQENLENIAAARLFRVVLELLEPEEQLDYLLERSNIAFNWLRFERSFKPLKNVEPVLLKLKSAKDKASINRILWFISTYQNKLTEGNIFEYLYPLLEHESSFIRSVVIKILYRTEDISFMQRFIDNSWQWNIEHHDLETHWGSLLFCKYGQKLPFSAVKARVHPAYLGLAIRFRGMDSEEIDLYAKYIDMLLKQIQETAPELPLNFPEIEIKITEDKHFTELDEIGLPDSSFDSSHTFTSSNYTWGGLEVDELDKPLRLGFEHQDNEHQESSEIIKETLKTQKAKGNYFFANKISKDVLLEIIKQNPNLVNSWLECLQDSKCNKLISICRVFYETLCCVLLEQSHPKAIDLYDSLNMAEAQIILVHSEINVRYLKYYLFQASPNNNIKSKWLEQFEKCRSDRELMELVTAAQEGKGNAWLKSYIAEKLESSSNLDFSRAVCILGFLKDDSTLDRLIELSDSQPDTWRKELVEVSIRRWQRNYWAKHWYKEFFNQSDRVLAWRSFRLFLQCADWRFWSWKEILSREGSSNDFYQSRLTFLEDNISSIKNSIRKNRNNKDITSHFLGCKIAHRQIKLFM